jgi:predicted lactoylglutathione lyase
MSLSRRGGHYRRADNEGGTDLQTIITLPIKERARAHRFYIDALGLEPVGEPWKDGIPEPLQFKLGDGVNLMLIPRKGFGWVLGEQPAAKAGLSECLLQYSCDEDDEVDVVIERAEKAGATVVLRPEKKSWGYTGSFSDPDGHLWVVTNAEPW